MSLCENRSVMIFPAKPALAAVQRIIGEDGQIAHGDEQSPTVEWTWIVNSEAYKLTQFETRHVISNALNAEPIALVVIAQPSDASFVQNVA